MLNSKTARYTMFGSLYFSQGTVFSYFTSLNALYFLSKGLSMADVGIFGAIALIPFVLKVFLGMLSDRVNLFGLGHRKPYIILGLIIQTLCLVIVPFIDPAENYWMFVAVAFILQMGMALYDTCTDGLALDTTPEKFDWSAFAAFKQKKIIALAAAGFLFFMVIAGTNQNVNPFLDFDFGISLRTAGLYTTVWGIGVVLGGMMGGRLIDRIGQKNSTRIALFFSFVSILVLAIIPNPAFAWPIVFVFGLSYGTYQTVYFALAMYYTEKRIAASMFSIFMAVTNIGQGVGFAVAGGFANIPAVGFRWAFVILALVNLVALPLLPMIFRKEPTAEMP